MKIIVLLTFLMIAVTGCNGCNKVADPPTGDSIIYKIHKKAGVGDIDTLWVSQNDTSQFKTEEGMQRHPGQKAELITRYELRHPQDGAYYFIYNPAQQLMEEGKYTAQYPYEGRVLDGNFYNTKSYYYKDNGKLSSIHYQVDGRNYKTEVYDSNRQLKEIIYFNKKSSDKEKVEIYKKGKLKETRIYTAFDVYHTIEADQ